MGMACRLAEAEGGEAIMASIANIGASTARCALTLRAHQLTWYIW